MAVPGASGKEAGQKSAGDWIILGRIGGPQGLKGALRIQSWTEPREAIGDYRLWYLRDGQAGQDRQECRPLKVQQQGKRLLVWLEGVVDRTAAEGLAGAVIEVPRKELPALQEGEFYWSDLEGLEVVTGNGDSLGRITRMMSTGANDVMVVQGERERLIPFVTGHTVLGVDLAASRVTVDWDKDF